MPISVIIPSWNAGGLLVDAIGSLDGDAAIGEIVVVDNASTDGSIDRLDGLDPARLRIIRNDHNMGAARARNVGVGAARYDLIAFLDADDMLSPDALGNAAARAAADDLDMCVLQMVSLFADGRTAPFVPPLNGIISGEEAFRRTLAGWKIHPMGVMRRAVYDRAMTGFAFHGHSDDELITRRLFLATSRVGGVTDRYLYRANSKPPTVERLVGQVNTELAVLQLAIERRSITTEHQLRKTRNYTIGWLFGLWRHLLKNREDPMVAAPLLRQVWGLDICWRPADGRYLLALAAMRASLPLLRWRKR